MTMDNTDFDTMFADNPELYDGLDDVETWDRLPWFEAGHRYLLNIDSVKMVPSQQDPSVRFYVMEFTILESDCDALAVGTRASHRIKCTRDRKTMQYGPMNFKQFLSGVLGVPASRKDVPWGQIAKAAMAEGKLNGKKVRLQTNLNKTGTFTNHNYSEYVENTTDDDIDMPF
jgi:hypothetical protein